MACRHSLISSYLLVLNFSLVLCRQDHYQHSNVSSSHHIHKRSYDDRYSASYYRYDAVFIIRNVLIIGSVLSFTIAVCVILCCRPACCRGKVIQGYILSNNTPQVLMQPLELGINPQTAQFPQQTFMQGYAQQPFQQQLYPRQSQISEVEKQLETPM